MTSNTHMDSDKIHTVILQSPFHDLTVHQSLVLSPLASFLGWWPTLYIMQQYHLKLC